MSPENTSAGVAPTQENRRAYREMLVTTPGLADGINGGWLLPVVAAQSVAVLGAQLSSGFGANQAAFAIHSQVHAARPDVVAAAHCPVTIVR